MQQTHTHNSLRSAEESLESISPGIRGLEVLGEPSPNSQVGQIGILQPLLTDNCEASALPSVSRSEKGVLTAGEHLPNLENSRPRNFCEMHSPSPCGEAEAHLEFNSLVELGCRMVMEKHELRPNSYQVVECDEIPMDFLQERLSLQSQMQDMDLGPSRSDNSVFSRGIQSWCGTARQASFLDSPPVVSSISATLPSTSNPYEKVAHSSGLATVLESNNQPCSSFDPSCKSKNISLKDFAAARERWAEEFADNFDRLDLAQHEENKVFESLLQLQHLTPSPHESKLAASSSSTKEGSYSSLLGAPNTRVHQGVGMGGGRTLSSSSSSSSDQPYSSKAPPLLPGSPSQYPPIKPPTRRPSDIPLPPFTESGPGLRQARSHIHGSLGPVRGEESVQRSSQEANTQQERRSEPGLGCGGLLSGSSPLTSSYGLLLHGSQRVQPPWRRNSLN